MDLHKPVDMENKVSNAKCEQTKLQFSKTTNSLQSVFRITIDKIMQSNLFSETGRPHARGEVEVKNRISSVIIQ